MSTVVKNKVADAPLDHHNDESGLILGVHLD
jgi:hypothetical protein